MYVDLFSKKGFNFREECNSSAKFFLYTLLLFWSKKQTFLKFRIKNKVYWYLCILRSFFVSRPRKEVKRFSCHFWTPVTTKIQNFNRKLASNLNICIIGFTFKTKFKFHFSKSWYVDLFLKKAFNLSDDFNLSTKFVLIPGTSFSLHLSGFEVKLWTFLKFSGEKYEFTQIFALLRSFFVSRLRKRDGEVLSTPNFKNLT